MSNNKPVYLDWFISNNRCFLNNKNNCINPKYPNKEYKVFTNFENPIVDIIRPLIHIIKTICGLCFFFIEIFCKKLIPTEIAVVYIDDNITKEYI